MNTQEVNELIEKFKNNTTKVTEFTLRIDGSDSNMAEWNVSYTFSKDTIMQLDCFVQGANNRSSNFSQVGVAILINGDNVMISRNALSPAGGGWTYNASASKRILFKANETKHINVKMLRTSPIGEMLGQFLMISALIEEI